MNQQNQTRTVPLPDQVVARDQAVFSDLAGLAGRMETGQYVQTPLPNVQQQRNPAQAVQPNLRQPATQPPPAVIPAQTPEPVPQAGEERSPQARFALAQLQASAVVGEWGDRAKLIPVYLFVNGTCWSGIVLPLMIANPELKKQFPALYLATLGVLLVGFLSNRSFLLRNGLIGLIALKAIEDFLKLFVVCRL